MMTSLQSCVARLGEGLRAFPWRDRTIYGDWLAQTYWYVRHSTRLLASSAARFGHDDFGNALHVRFAAHMAEEKRHELLALHDLKAIGLGLEGFAERASTRAFWEPQYYKVEHVNPVALFGYILALEAMSAAHGPWVFEQVAMAHGASAATFLKLHAHDDEDHVAKAIAMLERIDERGRADIEQNLQQSTFGYLTMLGELAAAKR
jgi:hypothetical protein